MSSNEELLEQARPFCDFETGEVLKRLPEDLMQKLRAAKLARGIPGKSSDKTETFATWYVFFTTEIQDKILLEWRSANRMRKKSRASAGDAPPAKPARSSKPAKPAKPASRGLKQFRESRKKERS